MSNFNNFAFACPCPTTTWAPKHEKHEKHDNCKCGRCKSSCQDCCDVCLKDKCCDGAGIHLFTGLNVGVLGNGMMIPLSVVAQSQDGFDYASPGTVRVKECGKYLIGVSVTLAVGILGPIDLVVERCDGSIRSLVSLGQISVNQSPIIALFDKSGTTVCLEPGDKIYLRSLADIVEVSVGIAVSIAKVC
ncbi:hypothetical protein COI93_03725 [Bacillus cereus]|uniref:Uncharacterized protein n=1 Tax=Bacillus cereus TaxID=1396 RepID=A0A2B0MR75_BACCE|nr:hypothetical protein COI93_03725 [Bacillus cereus]